MMALIPAWAWRWIAILLVLIGAFAAGAAKMHAHDQAKFDEFEAAVKEAGDKQNALTDQTIAAHKSLKEISDAEAKTLAAERDVATVKLRDIQSAIAGVSLLPPSAVSAAGSNRICFAADILDRGLRETVARASERIIAIAQDGQRGIDIAVTCREWAKGF
jgi:hypothetical protein